MNLYEAICLYIDKFIFSLKSKEFFPLCVLQMIMGIGPQVKYSPNMTSRLNKSVSEAVKNPFAVSLSILQLYNCTDIKNALF